MGSAEPQCGSWTYPVRFPHVPQCRLTPLLSLPPAVGLPVQGEQGGGEREQEAAGRKQGASGGGRREEVHVAGHLLPSHSSEPVNGACAVFCVLWTVLARFPAGRSEVGVPRSWGPSAASRL